MRSVLVVCLLLLLSLAYSVSAAAQSPSSSAQTSSSSIALGVAISSNEDPVAHVDTLASHIGRMPAFVVWFEEWSEVGFGDAEWARVQAIASRGVTPVISWSPWGNWYGPGGGPNPATPQPYQLRTIPEGYYDAYIDSWASNLAAFGQPVYLSFAHEMNGDWFPWAVGVNGNTAEDYIAAWRYVHDRFTAAGATNVRWVWTPNYDYGGMSVSFAEVFPGDDYIDWAGMTGYNWGTSVRWTACQCSSDWISFEELFGPTYEQLIALTSRPIMIMETASAEVGGGKGAWITNAFLEQIPLTFPQIRAVGWYNVPGELNASGEALQPGEQLTYWVDWRISSSASALDAFVQVAQSPLFQGTLPQLDGSARGPAIDPPDVAQAPPIALGYTFPIGQEEFSLRRTEYLTPIALGFTLPLGQDGPAEVDALAAQIGREPDFVQWYEAWTWEGREFGPAQMSRLEALRERGITALISWSPRGAWYEPEGGPNPASPQPYQLRMIVAGHFDATIDSWATGLAAFGDPVFLSFAHEMNGDWFPWSVGVNGNTAEDYIAAWRYVHDRFTAAGATNVRWVWTPNHDYGGTSVSFAEVFPGDDYIDWIGLTGYNWGTSMYWTECSCPSSWMTFEMIFGPSYEALTALSSKPILVSETGSAEQGGNKAAWIVETYSKQLPTKFPRIRAVSWFNATAGGSADGFPVIEYQATADTTDWRINTSAASLDAFVWMAHSPYLQGSLTLLDAAERDDVPNVLARSGAETRSSDDAVSAATPSVPGEAPLSRPPLTSFRTRWTPAR